jgi:hypothetical protein
VDASATWHAAWRDVPWCAGCGTAFDVRGDLDRRRTCRRGAGVFARDVWRDAGHDSTAAEYWGSDNIGDGGTI